MGRLGPLTSQGLGRSPYDDVVQGEGPEDPRGPQQLYDERGRPINPETKRINRDIIRSHNEVMMVIGVAEPDHGIAEFEAGRRHHQYEDRIGRRLLVVGGALETAAIWGVNGIRQRILLYKQYSQTTFYGMFQLTGSRQSLASYFFGGLPSFVASNLLEQLSLVKARKYPMIQYATTYLRLHLAIYTFFQRTGILPFSRLLPNWRFFIPGTSVSPIFLPPLPASIWPRNLLQWAGALALSIAPFAGFYLYTKLYSLVTRTLRHKIHRLLPRPHNANKRRQFRDGTPLPPGPELMPTELRNAEPVDPVPPTPTTTRRQSSLSIRGGNNSNNNNNNNNTATTSSRGLSPGQQDDFASDDEEGEMINATLISFDVEATDPTPDPGPTANTAGDTAAINAAPNVWAAELRPNMGPSAGDRPSPLAPGGPRGPEPVYRENVLTRLPALLATDVLAITPARLIMTPLAAMVWLSLARPYMARLGMPLDGVVQEGAGWWWGLRSGRGLVNMLGLELLLAVMHGETWALLMLVAEGFRYSEEEWNEREGWGKGGEGGEGAPGALD
ncbi:hypothetical protein N657DRAFT_612787 [Parathielavia appendiculata]|uniref:Uncharacterized protein n=1 Tax=Parathielavia appendiculata TaxID=2587402 RepID=A0AAN6U8F7_9PEZI|nr:hypothetical protein N657DRAFT_612787 [Parathielavia appendiculata]